MVMWFDSFFTCSNTVFSVLNRLSTKCNCNNQFNLMNRARRRQMVELLSEDEPMLSSLALIQFLNSTDLLDEDLVCFVGIFIKTTFQIYWTKMVIISEM